MAYNFELFEKLLFVIPAKAGIYFISLNLEQVF